jgi:hypothetical protein
MAMSLAHRALLSPSCGDEAALLAVPEALAKGLIAPIRLSRPGYGPGLNGDMGTFAVKINRSKRKKLGKMIGKIGKVSCLSG